MWKFSDEEDLAHQSLSTQAHTLKTWKIARRACVPTHCTLLSHWGPCLHSSHPYWLEQKLAQPWRKMRFNKRFNYLSLPLELPAGVDWPLEQLHLDLAKPSQLPLPELWKVIWEQNSFKNATRISLDSQHYALQSEASLPGQKTHNLLHSAAPWPD